MRLQELASLMATAKIVGDPEVEITGIQTNSKDIQPGDLFVCISGIPGYQEDREAAIHRAIEMVEADDIVMVAGKGHETYQILCDKLIPLMTAKSFVKRFF